MSENERELAQLERTEETGQGDRRLLTGIVEAELPNGVLLVRGVRLATAEEEEVATLRRYLGRALDTWAMHERKCQFIGTFAACNCWVGEARALVSQEKMQEPDTGKEETCK